MTLETAGEVTAWGRDVERCVVDGHPCLLYAHRRRSTAELLTDIERWSDRIAVVQGGQRITYSELGTRAHTVAAQLSALGVEPADRVLLLGYNSIDWLVGFFAAHLCDATVVLANAWWTAQDVRYAVELTSPSLVLVHDALLDRVPANVRSVNFVDLQVGTAGATGGTLCRTGSTDEGRAALVVFTSGTTGDSKGVVLSHRAVVSNLQNLLMRTGRLPSELDEDHPGTVSLMGLPLFHIGGLQSALAVLLTGGRVVFPTGRFDAREALSLIEREGVRFWGAVPTMVRRVLELPDFGRYDTSTVRSLTISGSVVEPELVRRARGAFPSAEQSVGTVYGLTEAGGILTSASGAELADRPGCVGRPMPVVEIRIDAPDTQGVGEVLARTPGAMTAYWPSVEAELDGDGWLRTGDLGRLDAGGYLFIVGRVKDLIIRGGENISPAHIERCLLEHSAVAEAAVLGLPHADLGEEVAAVVVRRAEHPFDINELCDFVRPRLASFEFPSRWWVRDEPLPINAISKIDKLVLRRTWQDIAPFDRGN